MVERRVRLERLLALGGILFVALYTRLYRLDLIDFKADEALIAGLARDVLAGKWPAASIQTSLGPFNPPLFIYLLAVPMHFSSNPAVLAGLVAALDGLAVFATYLVGTRVFGRVAGTAAALFYAADPYATIFSRKLAGTFVEPLIAICLLGCLFAAIERDGSAEKASERRGTSGRARRGGWCRQAAWFGSSFCLALLLQLHPATALLVPVLLLAWVLWGRWAALPGLLLGALAGAATFVPYLLFEFQRQPRFLHTLLSAAGGTAHWDARSLYLVWVLVSSGGYSDVTGSAAATYRAATPIFSWLPLLIGLAAVAGLLLAMMRWRHRRYALLLLFVLLPIGLTVRHSVGVEIHYFAFLLPGLFLLGGLAVQALVERWPVALPVATAGLAALLLGQLLSFRYFLSFLQSHDVSTAYGVPLAYQQQVAGEAAQLAAGDRIVVATADRDQLQTSRYLLHGQPNLETDAARGLLLPGTPRAVYVTLGDSTPAAEVLKAAEVPRRIIPLPGSDTFRIYVLDPTAEQRIEQDLNMLPARVALANGTTLVARGLPAALPGRMASLWQIGRPVPASTEIFNQLVDSAGKQWFDLDAVPAPASSWRAGDSVVELVPAVLPAAAPRQAYWWATGMYDHGGNRVPLAAGGSQVQLGPLAGGQPAAPAVPAHLLSVTFGGELRLDGYSLSGGRLTLYWTCLRRTSADYTVFVHALAPSGALVAQHDAQPLEGRFPTSLWQPGESVADPVSLAVPPAAHLAIGLYDLRTGQRLATDNGGTQVTFTP